MVLAVSCLPGTHSALQHATSMPILPYFCAYAHRVHLQVSLQRLFATSF